MEKKHTYRNRRVHPQIHTYESKDNKVKLERALPGAKVKHF